MNRFSRDYALVGKSGKVWTESHDPEILAAMQAEFHEDGIDVELVKSDLPRSRAK